MAEPQVDFNLRQADPYKTYCSGKVYTHSVGLSAAFRQWRAQSHCRFLHGYALQVEVEFASAQLDERNWVVDFGSLKSFKGWLEDTFDHKTLVAEDDPEMLTFETLQAQGLIQMVVVPSTGCEAFARIIYEYLEGWLKDNGYNDAALKRVTVREHAANFASYGITDTL
jgi:6-pyruvoyltetrahydropterin/6-carboxytetrahydropterin synthase